MCQFSFSLRNSAVPRRGGEREDGHGRAALGGAQHGRAALGEDDHALGLDGRGHLQVSGFEFSFFISFFENFVFGGKKTSLKIVFPKFLFFTLGFSPDGRRR